MKFVYCLFLFIYSASVFAEVNSDLITNDVIANPVSNRTLLITAAKGSSIPNSDALNKAWSYYEKYKGTWKNISKAPSQSQVSEIDNFIKELENKFSAAVSSEGLGPVPVNGQVLTSPIKLYSPEYNKKRQNENTQIVKSLAIMEMVKHELNDPDGGKYAKGILPRLLYRTPFDPDIYLLYSKIKSDQGLQSDALNLATVGICMLESPTDSDFDYLSYLALIKGNEAESVRKIYPQISSNSEQTEKAIERFMKAKEKYKGDTIQKIPD